MLAHVLGYVGLDNHGLAGLESRYDSQVRGQPGKVMVQTDAHQRRGLEPRRASGDRGRLARADDRSVPAAHRGARAANGVSRTAPPAAPRSIMDPATGEILALANWPTFNPNVSRRRPTTSGATAAIQELYEPGSTFKIVTASAALEEHVIEPDDLVNCAPGSHQLRQPDDPRRARVRRAAVQRRHRQVEQRRRDQGRPAARARAAGPVRQPVRVRPGARPRLPRRERRDRLEPVRPDAERAGLGVDGLPGRRHAAADGDGGQFGRQRRNAVSAARRARVHQGRAAGRGRAQGAAPHDLGADRTRADRDHGRRHRARDREGRADRRLHGRGQDRHGGEARQRPLFAVRLQRVVRRVRAVAQAARSPSSSSSTRRRPTATTAAPSPRRSSNASPKRRCGISASRRRSIRRRRCFVARRDERNADRRRRSARRWSNARSHPRGRE